MKSSYRIISMFLTLLLLFGALECLMLTVSADGDSETSTEEGEEEESKTVDYTVTAYVSEADKLATMTHYPHADKKVKSESGKVYTYQLWVDEYSGEVAEVYCDQDGNIIDTLFTNPYDVGVSTASTAIKQQILSQITVKYTDNDNDKYFYSYEQAALRDQIKVKKIKNGIRVEYTIGREEARLLLPRMITSDRLEEKILAPMREALGGETNFYYKKFKAFYLEKNLEKLTSERAKEEMLAAFPIVAQYAIWVFDPDASDAEKNTCEELIKANCPEYTYEELDLDHEMTKYSGEEDNPPLFKMALEYTLDANGMSVRLPANGIRFDESLYQLTYVEVLPYMGAGNNYYEGYTFYPDGSGALFSLADPALKTKISVNGKVYGSDYAYHTISARYEQVIRYPVFGIQEDTEYTLLEEEDGTGVSIVGSVVKKLEESATVSDDLKNYKQLLTQSLVTTGEGGVTRTDYVKSRAFLAIIEEGDALASIQAYTDATESEYSILRMQFNPRPKDTYNIQDSISVGSDSEWTVVCNRKYVGNYKIRYILCTDEAVAESAEMDDYYDASWFGMATAYRDYLEREGQLTRLTADDVEEDIPLYIESFGALETTQRILSVPVDVMTPLTTFEDIRTIYDELSEAGIRNINFKLTGFANGGMYSYVPYDLNWENAVGGSDGFQELLDYAKEVSEQTGKHLGIYPDFDFSYISMDSLFDATVLKQHASKTIDDRYASKKYWSATQQKYYGRYEMVLSPAYMSHFYKHLVANYLGNYENVTGISVATLGSALNSDFDEDEPYNREDAKEFTINAFAYLDKAGLSIMTEGGNAYTWKYVDHILGMPLDSSHYNKASSAVPFTGVVLHGYKQFADDPLNMEGNIQYAMLKIIENGASPYFTLSYQNTQELKEYTYLSSYYSVRYDIWKEDLIDKYTELNDVLKDVQLNLITNHEFIDGVRVPDTDEIEADIDQIIADYRDDEIARVEEAEKLILQQVGNARKKAREICETLAKKVTVTGSYSTTAQTSAITAAEKLAKYQSAVEEYLNAVNNGWDKLGNSEDAEDVANYTKYTNAEKAITAERFRLITALAQVNAAAIGAADSMQSVEELLSECEQALNDVRNGVKDVEDESIKTIIAETERFYKLSKLYYEGLEGIAEEGYYQVRTRYQDEYFDKLFAGNKEPFSLEADFVKISKYLTAKAALDKLIKASDELETLGAAVVKAQKQVETKQTELEAAADKDDAAKEKAQKALDSAKDALVLAETNRDNMQKLVDALKQIGKDNGYELTAETTLKVPDMYYTYSAVNENALNKYCTYQVGEKLRELIPELDSRLNDYVAKYVLAERYLAAKKASETADNDAQKAKAAYEADKNDASLKATYEEKQKIAETRKQELNAYLAKDPEGLQKVSKADAYAESNATWTFIYGDSGYGKENLTIAKNAAENALRQEIADELGTTVSEGVKKSVATPEQPKVTEFFTFANSIILNRKKAEDTYKAAIQSVLEYCATVDIPDKFKVTQKDVDDRNTISSSSKVEEEETFDKYAVTDQKIVAVTYGDDNGKAVKVIIINYNNFAVKVEYNGKLYTIAKFGYEVITDLGGSN